MGLTETVPLLLLAWFLSSTHIGCALAERSTYIVHIDKSLMPKVFASHHYWYNSMIDSTKSVGQTSDHHFAPKLLYTYDNAFHGFSALMSKDQLETLKKSPGFVSAHPEKTATIDTTRTPEFLALNAATGLWPAAEYGKDVIIGIVDTGIWPENPSFKDDGMTPIPARWKGTCQEGQEFNSSLCNLKLIGARYFNKAVLAANPNLNLSMNSARATSGHGTHVGATAAGNYVEGVSFFGYASGTARGIAPRARLAVYKVLWDEGNYESDVLAGIDQAVADGVDVISISLGFDFTPPYEEPLAIASFGAMEKGIFVSTSAGNDGPDLGTVHNDIPWALTVAAGSVDRWFAGSLTLGNGLTIVGWTVFPARAVIEVLLFVMTLSHSENKSAMFMRRMSKQLFLFLRIPRIFRSNIFPHPGVVISPKDAAKVITYASIDSFPTATIKFQQTIVGTKPAPVVSGSSSRGPAPNFPGILKPDVMAPGILILAAYHPDSSEAQIGSNIFLSTDFTAISGTSMACPHASGIAALLKGAHPEWSPAAIRSAMMTTANTLDNTKSPIKDTGRDNEVATPLAIGAGHVDPNRSLDPGLIYDATPQDYVNFICSMNFTQTQTLAIIRSASYNCSNPSSDLNYPSFIALYETDQTKSKLVKKFQRTLTNVGNGAATYKAEVTAPKGSMVTISPKTISFGKKYEKQSYSLTINYKGNDNQIVTFGSLTWIEDNGNHVVRSPIVIAPRLERS
ncbi:hypothetical protein ACH5RR_034995 [Cinchona calisaya]|uniref:Subtilisin-like protease SBT1.9 n=1 Tax=Cinchona calisaya TaxID=153742 RepID=A0ABD2YCI9_9GENT